jgi:hypothetical protein
MTLPDSPGGVSSFVDSNLDSVNNPELGGAWSGLDTGDISSRIHGSSCMTSVHPLSGPDCGELDDGRAADDPSGFVNKWSSEWPKRHSSFNLSPRFSDTSSWPDTGNGTSSIDGSGCSTSIEP